MIAVVMRLTPTLLALLLLAACGGAAPDLRVDVTFDTLPNGAVLVSNPAEGTWGGAGWRLVEEGRFGALDGDGPDVFGGTVHLALGQDGAIFVGDAQSSEIRIFAADGAHLRTVGRSGGGPGEFQQISGMDWGPDGNLWVMDARNSRFAVVSPAGDWVTSHPRPSGFMRVPWPGRFDRQGRLIDMNGFPGPDGSWTIGFLRYDAGMTARDTLVLPTFDGESYTILNEAGLPMVSAAVPFTPWQGWTLTRDGDVWLGVSDRYRIYRLGFGGDTIRALEKPFTPVRVTPSEREAALGRLDWFREQGGRVDASRVPSTKPAFGPMFSDDEGYLWILAMRPEGENPAADVFDPEGVYLGRVELPQGVSTMPQPAIRGNRMAAAVRGALDELYVVSFRIEGR